VLRACLAGGSDEDEPNEDSEVESESCDRLAPRPLPLDLPLSLPFPLPYFPLPFYTENAWPSWGAFLVGMSPYWTRRKLVREASVREPSALAVVQVVR
jgi:hypothetical protein